MLCPHCHHNGSRVIDSRPAEDHLSIRRRRECINCGFRFTTFERYEETPLLVVKKDGTREGFSRQKILNGLVRAAEKRPVSMDQLTKLADQVESQVRRLGENEVASQVVGEYVMEALKSIDEIAYIRFASVYRQFKDVEAFTAEIAAMKKEQAHDEHQL